MKIRLVELAFFLSLFICIFSCLSFEKDCESIRNEVMRLHVIANSDSYADQQLKLAVRDQILLKSTDIFGSKKSIDSVCSSLKKSKDKLKAVAEDAIGSEGFSYEANITVGKSYFPTRQYGNITLPAGYYNSVKVIIGEGKGKNWWCVLFPPMCLPAAAKDEVKLDDVLSHDEIRLVNSNPKYEVRFWIVEKIQQFKRSYKQRG